MPRYYFNKGVADDIAPGEEGMESRTREAVQRLRGSRGRLSAI